LIYANNEDQGIPVTALREIRILQNMDHENVIELMEIAVEKGILVLKRSKLG
jgi:hypothetical protein